MVYGNPYATSPSTREDAVYWTVTLIMTRGFVHELIRIFNAHRLKFKIDNKTVTTPGLDSRFQGSLTSSQKNALEIIGQRRFGIIAGPTGSGKKALALHLASEKKLATLIVVKTKAQLYQWKECIQRLLGLKEEYVGLIGDGHYNTGARITVAIDRTLYRKLNDLKKRIGFLIVDQCDAANLKIFFQAVNAMESTYMLGLASASKRRDGLDGIMKAYLGPILCELEREFQYRGKGANLPSLSARETGFKFDYKDNFGQLMTALSQDPERNGIISADILEAAADPKTRALIVCERIEQAQRLKAMLTNGFVNSAVVCGRTSQKQTLSIQRKYDQGKLQIILATQKSIGRLTVKKTNHLFVAAPQKFGDHLFQAMGRLLENHQEKEALAIHDYMDEPDVLKASFRQRLKLYRTMGLSSEKAILKDKCSR